MSRDLTAALHGLLNSASEDLKQCLVDDLNHHLSTIRKLGGGRSYLNTTDLHNLLLRWSITSQAVVEDKAPERSNMLAKFEREIAEESAVRGRIPHPSLTGD